MTQDEIISMARELASRHGSRMCDENGETHGEELYCVGVEDIAEIIKQVAAHERERVMNEPLTKAMWDRFESEIRADERETCAKSVYDSTDWAHEERDMVLKEAIAAAIRARGNV